LKETQPQAGRKYRYKAVPSKYEKYDKSEYSEEQNKENMEKAHEIATRFFDQLGVNAKEQEWDMTAYADGTLLKANRSRTAMLKQILL